MQCLEGEGETNFKVIVMVQTTNVMLWTTTVILDIHRHIMHNWCCMLETKECHSLKYVIISVGCNH